MNLKLRRHESGFVVSISTIMQYFFLYLMYISHGSVIYTINVTQLSNFIIGVCVAYVLLHWKMYRNLYVVNIVVLIGLMGALMLIHSQPYFMKVAFRIIESLLVLLVSYWIDKQKFVSRFVKVTLFFAIVSLGFYTIQVFAPQLLQSILQVQPAVTGWESSPFYGKWLYTYRGIYALYRNNGIFTEPGLYQMILNSALAIVLFFPQLCEYSKKKYIFVISILVITIVTTSSTTGYMGMLIIMIGYLLRRNKSAYSSGIKRHAVFVLVLAVLAIIWDYYIRAYDSILYLNVISKFEDIGVLENASGGARLSVIEICIGMLVQDPFKIIFGFGYSQVSRVITMSGAKTAGAFICYFLTAAGLPVTIFMLYPYLIKPFGYKGYFIENIIFVLLYFNTSLAQSREAYPTLIILPFVFAALSERDRLNKCSLEMGLEG